MQLTRSEEQVMQILWGLGEGLVKDILDKFDDPKPARNTVSTVVRILEKKGFVGHKDYGKVFVYYPLVQKKEYSGKQLIGLMNNYFNNSFPAMASFFAKENDLSIRDLELLLEETKKELVKRNKTE
ncbi:MAG: BlaI/MecI/CopY family transcriptional regulator [Prolixibacteraceae bacterium]|jgi:predicted transcriptional regulator|nr:BlaI/MecI/CopY family transcriptional regulator [Prolixibacteraceae bacterium]MCX6220042.1 BlaI/MecI/CopY family transcriptional regulator [Bacteroidia bacterium]